MTLREGDDHRPAWRTVPLAAAALTLWIAALALLPIGHGWAALTCALVALVWSMCLTIWSLLSRRFVAVTVRGQSMEPTFHDGDWLLVRRGRAPVRGQVVVVERPAVLLAPGGQPLLDSVSRSISVAPEYRWVVKRVAAISGDPVPRDKVPALASVPEHRVPPGKLVLLGDNQQASFDSRRLGYFPDDQVLGVVVRPMTVRPRPRAEVETLAYGAFHERPRRYSSVHGEVDVKPTNERIG
jgi:signal peptidase I